MDAGAGPAVSRHMHDDEEERHDETRDGPPEGRFPDPSFVDELRGIYLQRFRAAQETETPRRRERAALRLPLRVRPALVVALTLIFTGAAVAAVTLSLKRSAPLSGRVPPVANAARWGFGFTEAGARYRIVFAPMLSAGDAGWRSFVYLGRAGRQGSVGTLGGYPTAQMPLLPAAGNYPSTAKRIGEILHYALTGPSVAAVQVGTEAIQTRSSAALPAGDRIAVFTLPAADGYRREPSLPSRHLHVIPITPRPVARLRMIPLDSHGEPIATTDSPENPPTLPARVWRRQPDSPAKAAGGELDAPGGVCGLSRRGLPALMPTQAEVATELRPIASAVGELLLSCLQTTYTLHGSQLRAAILLNARHPGLRPPGPIPGARPVKGHPGTVNAVLGPTVGDITARRSGSAWLAVAGGSGLAQRLEVLAALRIAKIAAQKPHGS